MKTDTKHAFANLTLPISIMMIIISIVFIFNEAMMTMSGVENPAKDLSFLPYIGIFLGVFLTAYASSAKDALYIKKELELYDEMCSDKTARKIKYKTNSINVLKGNMDGLEGMGYVIVITPDVWVYLYKEPETGNIKVVVPTQMYFAERHRAYKPVRYSNLRFIEKLSKDDLKRQVL